MRLSNRAESTQHTSTQPRVNRVEKTINTKGIKINLDFPKIKQKQIDMLDQNWNDK